MDVSQMLSGEPDAHTGGTPKAVHGYTTRRSSYVLSGDQPEFDVISPGLNALGSLQNGPSMGGRRKLVTFRLVLSDNAQQTARLPLKVYVSPHDTTDSIISTTKNFYGLYEGQGISFEDDQGVALIAQYENLGHNSTIFVRVRDERPSSALTQRPVAIAQVASPVKPWLDEPIQLQPPPPLRTSSPSKMHRTGSFRGLPLSKNDDAANGLSDSDAGSVSVSSSRRAKSDGLASAEISLENIVEGGRRKRAKFESSELPLFIPPQVPITASMSSASPQRKILNANIGSPYNTQGGFNYGNVLPSPQSNGRVESIGSTAGAMPAPYAPGQRLRGRSSGNYQPSRFSSGGVLPTPDPTIGGSVISDEDVALQLMRLGDPGNFSHGRLSNSTLDETLSGKAEAASSSVENSDADSELDEHDQDRHARYHGHGAGPARKKIKGQSGVGGAQGYYSDESSEYDYYSHSHHQLKMSKSRRGSIASKAGRQRTSSKSKHHDSSSKLPPSPYSMDHRKGSTGSSGAIHQHFADDEEDLSSRPRCQRCRKSKKGCDRQRPCGRCKDAGIGIEGCISEDEGNGRKGRYGRHMGVPIKKDAMDAGSPTDNMPILSAYAAVGIDASKKRKR